MKKKKKAQAPEAKAVQEELEALRAKADEYLDLAKRERAEFLNYQERVKREKADWSRQAVEGFLEDFLPALDSLALARFEEPKLTEAVRLIEREFLRVLAKKGIVPIETVGKTFDPQYHDAVSVEVTPEKPDGEIVEEVRRGWMMEGRVLRPSGVRLAKAPPPEPASG